MNSKQVLYIVPFLLWSIVAYPIDLYNPDAIKYSDTRVARTDTGPGICKENINNDNNTNTKWYRYHNETHKCFHIDERGPCGKMMLFYGIGDSDYGDCDCNFYYRCARPLIYWAPAGRCYYTNDRGPCNGTHEWLILDDKFQPSCQLNPCMQNQTLEPSTYDRYWFEKEGQCYKTLTQGYCEKSQEVLYPKWDDYQPTCNIGRVCNSRNPRSSGSVMQCIPGQKLDQFGKCRAPVRINNWLQFSIFKK